ELKTAAEISKKLDEMEHKMYQAARDLEFETAANLRDQMADLREQLKVV
ncbi:unnamed protein product, partial [Chrysoparadoxa australica]